MPTWTVTARRAISLRRARPVALLSLAAGLAMLGAAPSAMADTTPISTGPIVSVYHAKCVDDLGDSADNGTPVVISDCNGSAEQDWAVEADGTIQLNGKCLDVFRQWKANKTVVELWTCNGGANQQWTAAGDTLVSVQSGKCMDDPQYNTTDGTQLIIYTCSGGRNQEFALPPAADS
jgi:hypothetical protein